MATLLETYLEVSVRVGLGSVLFVGSWYVLYVVFGIAADFLGVLDPPYPFLSLEADPFFVIGGAVIGFFIVQSTGSLVLYQFLTGLEDDRSQFAVLWCFIGLGFGGALLRVTFIPAVRLVLELL